MLSTYQVFPWYGSLAWQDQPIEQMVARALLLAASTEPTDNGNMAGYCCVARVVKALANSGDRDAIMNLLTRTSSAKQRAALHAS